MASIQSIILYVSIFISLFFEVFLLITYFEVKDEISLERGRSGAKPDRTPSVTILVPSFNEEQTVRATVESLLALDYPRESLSIFLIDDGSKDKTLEVMNEFKDHPQIRIFSKENEGSKFAALNYGLKHVTSELVGCLDADSFVASDALCHMIPYFDDAETMAVTPSLYVHEPKTILQKVQKIEYNWGIFQRRLLASMGALYVTPGPFSIFRARVFDELGGYKRAHHTEDMEMALRLQKNGYKIVHALGARVYTSTPEKLGGLYKQRTRWSYGFLNNVFDYRDMYFNKKYGHLAFFILPIATLSIFFSIFAAGNLIWNFGQSLWNSFELHRFIGWSFHLPHLNLDWFYLNTSMTSILAAIAIALSIGLLLLALRIAEGKTRIGRDVIYYLSIYMFIVPLWLTKALFQTVIRSDISWR